MLICRVKELQYCLSLMRRPEECTSAFLHPLIRTIMQQWGEVTAGVDLWPLLSGGLCSHRGSRFSQPLYGGGGCLGKHIQTVLEYREESGDMFGTMWYPYIPKCEWDAPPQALTGARGPDTRSVSCIHKHTLTQYGKTATFIHGLITIVIFIIRHNTVLLLKF